MIPFNKPHQTGKELLYIKEAIEAGKISGNGKYTKKCQDYFSSNYNFGKCLLTQSCTDALEMAAILCDINEGDEVIVPSYTFVSTANAFKLRGASIVFADSNKDHPNIDVHSIEKLITERTKVIVPVHYSGNACEMNQIMKLAKKHDLFVVEDSAQAFDGHYISNKGAKKPLGSFGHFSAFSFHETKNIISGEGGMLVVNDQNFNNRAEIIWEKGTNRSAFFRGEIDKYGWVDIGSSYLPSEVTAAFLYAQLEQSKSIQNKRQAIWKSYYRGLKYWCELNGFLINKTPEHSDNNAHMFYIIVNSEEVRNKLLNYLKSNRVHATFHYQSLHRSEFMKNNLPEKLANADMFSERLIRLPLYPDLSLDDVDYIIKTIIRFSI